MKGCDDVRVRRKSEGLIAEGSQRVPAVATEDDRPRLIEASRRTNDAQDVGVQRDNLRFRDRPIGLVENLENELGWPVFESLGDLPPSASKRGFAAIKFEPVFVRIQSS
jgi:hypothetical protein